MYPRKLRLPITKFPRHAALLFASPGITIKARRNDLSHNRFGILAGIRVSKKATLRHRVKRMLSHLTVGWPPLGMDILIIAEPPIQKMSFKTLQEECKKALIKVSAYSTP